LFPRRTLRGDAELFRIHRRDRGAWWFSADGSGRFDPVGTGLGACYLTMDPLGAWVEVFRETLLIDRAELRARALTRVALGRALRLADLTSRRALGFGVTASLGADRRYDASHKFAADAVAAGFDGIRYLVRHDPAQKLYGIALFGEPEARAARDREWPRGTQEPIGDELVDEAGRRFGYRVLPAP
jgi:hypothetical protein